MDSDNSNRNLAKTNPSIPTDDMPPAYVTGIRQVWLRLMPVLLVAYVLNFLDRTNIALAKTRLDADLGISAAAFGLGAGLFFLAYCTLEVPSNIMMHRVGARRWIGRIVISWGTISTLTMFVQGEVSFYVMRLLLGIAEAGFYPGMLFYFTLWFAPRDRAVAVGTLLMAPQVATIFGSPLGGAIMNLDGNLGLHGWQWLLLIEGLPTVAFGVFLWFYLPDGPRDAKWLDTKQQNALTEATNAEVPEQHSIGSALRSVFSSTTLLVIALLYFVTQLCVYGITFFMPSIIEAAGVTGTLRIGAVAGLPAVGALIGVFVYPRLYRIYGHPAAFIAVAMAGAAAATFAASNTGVALSLLSLAVMQFFVTGTAPVLWSVAMSRLRGVQSAAGLAMINAIGLLGGFFGPTLFGVAESRTGDPASAIHLLTFACLGALAVAGVLRVLLVRSSSADGPVRDHPTTSAR
jgi:MFS family permease